MDGASGNKEFLTQVGIGYLRIFHHVVDDLEV
jgi:hypothetical protein